jgi:hypothetical protein
LTALAFSLPANNFGRVVMLARPAQVPRNK